MLQVFYLVNNHCMQCLKLCDALKYNTSKGICLLVDMNNGKHVKQMRDESLELYKHGI